MAKVLCTLPNASNLINGVRFASVPDGMLSEEISDDVAANFASIPGYVLTNKKGVPVPVPSGEGDPTPVVTPPPA